MSEVLTIAISGKPYPAFEPAQNLGSGFDKHQTLSRVANFELFIFQNFINFFFVFVSRKMFFLKDHLRNKYWFC